MNYESPITLIMKKYKTFIEDNVLKACQRVGIFVDKEELCRALNYDRQQYEKGFNDARKKDEEKMNFIIDEMSRYVNCDICPCDCLCVPGEDCNGRWKDYLMKGENE